MGWRVITETIRGASHKRSDKPNQDAVNFIPKEPGDWAIVALADGHGSNSYFLSDSGARFAVAVAVDVCKKYLDSNNLFFAQSEQSLKEGLCKKIVNEWQIRVHEHHENSEIISNNINNKSPHIVKKNQDPILTPYGSTLIIVIVSKALQAYFQLGDGNILTVNKEGNVTPIFPYQLDIGDDTLSLILPNCSDDFKLRIVHEPEETPSLILVSTDGYAKSFQDRESYEQVASDFFNILWKDGSSIEEGIKVIKDNLVDWLEETSTKGSGDDITVGLLIQE